MFIFGSAEYSGGSLYAKTPVFQKLHFSSCTTLLQDQFHSPQSPEVVFQYLVFLIALMNMAVEDRYTWCRIAVRCAFEDESSIAG
jgi:hypothetical protein